jgi:hypothetical protein
VAAQDLSDLLGLGCQRFDLQSLRDFCQTAPQPGFVGFPSHLEIAALVAPAVAGEAPKRV